MAADARGDDASDHGRRQFATGRQQPVAVRLRPFALLVELADDARAHVLAPVVELLLELVFEQLALFLDDEDLLQPFGEMPHAFGFQRPDHADLVEPDADLGGEPVVDAEVVESLAHVQIGLAAGDDAQARVRAVDDDLVELVGAGVGQCGVELVVQQALFLHQAVVRPSDVEPARRQRGIGQRDLDAMRVDVNRSGGLDRVGHRLEGDPAAGIARHGPAMQAEIEVVLHAGGRQHRHHHRLEGVLGLVWHGGGARGVVVAGDDQHSAVLRRAGGIGVAEDVAATVDARPLAVPHAEHAVVFGAGEEIHLLRAPDGSGSEVFVYTGLELDVVRVEMLSRAPQGQVEAAERRAAIA